MGFERLAFHPHGDWVDTDDLNRGLNPWNVYQLCDGHFPTPAYEVLGERFARKDCLLIDPKLKLGDEVFSSGFFDTSADIASHGAISGIVRGSKPTNESLAALSDGKFGSADPGDTRWLTFEPGENGSTEVILDLGENTPINLLGINLLFHPGAAAFYPTGMTFATSEDGQTFTQVGRDIRFTYGKNKSPDDVEPQSLLAAAANLTPDGEKSIYARARDTAAQFAFYSSGYRLHGHTGFALISAKRGRKLDRETLLHFLHHPNYTVRTIYQE